jgi:AcrR family transcriptional regulator
MSLHDEQGITRTSVRDIAGRAGVAPATVLHHFARMDDLIQACGELSSHLAPIPTEAVLVGARSTHDRARLMARAMFAWWDQLGTGFDHLRVDRHHVPDVDAWLHDVTARHRRLAVAALEDGDLTLVDLLVALTTPDAWGALRETGSDPDRAAGRVAQLIGQASVSRKGQH